MLKQNGTADDPCIPILHHFLAVLLATTLIQARRLVMLQHALDTLNGGGEGGEENKDIEEEEEEGSTDMVVVQQLQCPAFLARSPFKDRMEIGQPLPRWRWLTRFMTRGRTKGCRTPVSPCLCLSGGHGDVGADGGRTARGVVCANYGAVVGVACAVPCVMNMNVWVREWARRMGEGK